jgi:light-regulated signal transduction histidine kinase (bacteriophytochrome)
MKTDFTTEQLKAILESVHDAIYIGDRKGLSSCNQRCLELLGCTQTNELTLSAYELNKKLNSRYAKSGKRIPPEQEPYVQALKGKKVVKEIIITNCMNGEDKYIRCAASPVYMNDEIMGAIVVNTDITEAKLSEQKLKEVLKDAETSNKELQAFTYAVSHDLKSPLSRIYGLAALLLKSDESQISEKDKYMLNLIMQSSDQLGQLINRLLTLSKISKTEFNYQEVDLSKLAQMVLENYSFEHQGEPDIEIEDDLIAYGDEALLLSLVQNLLTNALKYSSKQRRPKIRMGVKTAKDKKIFFIQDNGVGFDPVKVGDLFKPFKRLHQNSEFSGTGIGLSTVKRIIERHGGDVWAESEPGKGATFYFFLPDRSQLANLKHHTSIILHESLKNKISA